MSISAGGVAGCGDQYSNALLSALSAKLLTGIKKLTLKWVILIGRRLPILSNYSP